LLQLGQHLLLLGRFELSLVGLGDEGARLGVLLVHSLRQLLESRLLLRSDLSAARHLLHELVLEGAHQGSQHAVAVLLHAQVVPQLLHRCGELLV